MWFLPPFSKTTGTVELVSRHSWPLLRHQYTLELVNGHLTSGSTAELFGNRISYDWDCISFLWSRYFCSLAPLTNSTVLVPRLLLGKYFGCNMCYSLGLREWADWLQSQICGVCHGQRSLRHSPSWSMRLSWCTVCPWCKSDIWKELSAWALFLQPTPPVMPSTSSMSLDSRCDCHGEIRALIQTSTRTERELQRRFMCHYLQ